MPSQIDPATIAMIFRSLRGRFGNAFVDKFRSGQAVASGQHAGKDSGLVEAMEVWAYELRQLTQADIQHGLTCRFKYPPSSDEFITACCTREITPPKGEYNSLQLEAPKMTRAQAEKHITQIGAAVKSVAKGPGDRVCLEWALMIADETARGVYRANGGYSQRLAADAFYENQRPVPESLKPFLSAKYRGYV
ncbi:hypothetical protein [Chromobacterium rhizoryzae]|uniref:hypothetical protein n=1 Tax=Chromobacterium rhizoryzae TaxID=1778675 RepID=UPI0013C2BA9E|nr:hypothetical protein [Chromobacterium rhizoryzae]